MSWWKPLVLVIGLPLVMVVLQVVFYLVAGLIEGSDDPLASRLTPMSSLAANLSIALTGLLAVVLVARFAKVPWRRVLSAPRRFDGRRLAFYLLASVPLAGAGFAVVALVAPDSTGWIGFSITGTTVALIVVGLLTTPLQAAGEELLLRGAVMPAAASWVRAVRPALVLGVVVSSILFAVIHGSTDPWFFGYYLVIAIATALMAIISRGLEAPIAFHIANNVLVGLLNAVMADGGYVVFDRATDTGGPYLLILTAVNVSVVVVVWLRERALRSRTAATRGARPIVTS